MDEDYYQCDICSRSIHPLCSSLTGSEKKCMPLQKRLLIFACEECKEVLKKIPSLLQIMEEVKKQLVNVGNTGLQPPSMPVMKYSEKVKRRPEEVIVIKPKDKKQESLVTKKAIEEQINPSEIGVGISQVKFVREGGVAISCARAQDVENMSHSVENKMSKEYEVKIPERKHPRLKIINIEKALIDDQDVFIEKMIIQNGITVQEEERKINILTSYEDKRRKTGVAIVEVDEETYKQISKKDVLYIGWKKCRYFDHVNVIQCYRCWKFGHMARECKSSEYVCPKCSKNHKLENCKSVETVCINCRHAKDILKIPNIEYNHTANNKTCEAYKRIFRQLQMRVNYPSTSGRSNL